MEKSGISAVVPVYNEEKSVENTVRQLRENLEKTGQRLVYSTNRGFK